MNFFRIPKYLFFRKCAERDLTASYGYPIFALFLPYFRHSNDRFKRLFQSISVFLIYNRAPKIVLKRPCPMRFRLIYSSWLNLAKLKLKAPRAFLKMKRQDLILKKKTELTKLTELLGALPDLPKSLTICEYSSHHGIDIDGVTTLEKALEIVKEFKRNLLLPAHDLNYYGLGKEWSSKTCKYTEVLRVTYKVGRHGDLDAYETPSIKFLLRNPAKTLKALGVKCRIKTVRKEARIVEARETREVVCPLSA